MRLSSNAFGLALPTFMSSPDVYWLGAYRPAGGSTVTTNGLLIDGNAVWLHPAVRIRAKQDSLRLLPDNTAFQVSFRCRSLE